MLAILSKELKLYFYTPIGYIVLGLFLFISGYFFSTNNLMYGIADMKIVFSSLSLVFIFFVPILTMRLFSEENKSGTIQLLISSPVRFPIIVISKYLSAFTVFFIAILITMIYPAILYIFSYPSFGEIFIGYIGFILMGAVFISIGLFLSSITENQVISAVSCFSVLFILWLLDMVIPFIQNDIITNILLSISIFNRFESFSLGILNYSHIVFFISIIVLFIYLTVYVLKRKRLV